MNLANFNSRSNFNGWIGRAIGCKYLFNIELRYECAYAILTPFP